jgi:predicted dehydrogenase
MKNDTGDYLASAPLTRRQFLATSTKAAATATLVGGLPGAGYTAESNTIKIVLVGCGGRGTGAAAQALSTQGPTKLWAMADFFDTRLQSSLALLKEQKPGQVDVPPERQFVGLDAFKKAMDTVDKGSVVLLATPPAFRPIHVDYAISKDLHVFMEKSFAVDAPGIRRILKCGAEAQRKNLKIATGLRCRHDAPLEEAVKNIHEGIIGEVSTAWAYRMQGPVGDRARESSWNELACQIANFAGFTWLNGSFIVDWLIHNIDICCWVKNDWPVSVQGMGGRQVREDPDQLFDHYDAEYTFADGTRLVAQGRLIEGCWAFFGDQIHGATGSALLGEGVDFPRIFKGFNQTSENLIWSFKGQKNNAYQTELDLLFEAIRDDKPYNETEWSAKSNLTAIMGRMACESGQKITWEDAMKSNLELAPGLEAFTQESNPPVMPDANGRYPVAKPGKTMVL